MRVSCVNRTPEPSKIFFDWHALLYRMFGAWWHPMQLANEKKNAQTYKKKEDIFGWERSWIFRLPIRPCYCYDFQWINLPHLGRSLELTGVCWCLKLSPATKFLILRVWLGWCAKRTQGLYWFGQNIPTSSLLLLLMLLALKVHSRGYK